MGHASQVTHGLYVSPDQGAAPGSHESPSQYARPGAPASCVWTYWPVVHAVSGAATTVTGSPAASAVGVAGGVLKAGSHVPGMPAVARVDGTMSSTHPAVGSGGCTSVTT